MRPRCLVKKINIPASKVSAKPHFHLAKGGSNLDIEKLHQVWRYGIKIKPEDEKKLIEWLEKVCNYIEENINQ